MIFDRLTTNLNTHQSLPDQPALDAEKLKRLWDEAPNAIKDYLNDIFLPKLEKELQNKVNTISGKILSTNDFTDEYEAKVQEMKKISYGADIPTHEGEEGEIYIQYF